MKILFEEYAPDQPALGPISRSILNVIPALRSYRSFPKFQILSNALTERCRGGIAVRDSAGNVYNYAGDANFLYKLNLTSFSAATTIVTGSDVSFSSSSFIKTTSTDLSVFDVSSTIRITNSANNNTDQIISSANATSIETTGTTIVNETASATVTIQRIYNTSSQNYWEFAKYGELLIGTNYNDPVQAVSLGAAYFSNLAGAPPKARHIGVVSNFVVLGDTNNNGSADASRVYWCALNTPTSWTPSAATQADTRGLKGMGGYIMHISSGDVGYIFQQHSIWVMNYVGPPSIFSIQEVDPGKGALTAKGQARIGRFCFYIGQDGFNVFDGVSSRPIGANKVNVTFFNDLDQSYLDRVSAAIDPKNNLVIWAYPGVGNIGGSPNKLLVYSWVLDKWSQVEVDAEFIYNSYAQGYTLDSLDSISSSIDSLTFSLDSQNYMGGAVKFSAFDNNHKLNTVDGSAMNAVVVTNEFQFNEQGRSVVTRVEPIVNNQTVSVSSSCTLRIGYRDNQRENLTWTPAINTSSLGRFQTRKDARYHRFELTVSGEFDNIVGLDVTSKPTGKR